MFVIVMCFRYLNIFFYFVEPMFHFDFYHLLLSRFRGILILGPIYPDFNREANFESISLWLSIFRLMFSSTTHTKCYMIMFRIFHSIIHFVWMMMWYCSGLANPRRPNRYIFLSLVPRWNFIIHTNLLFNGMMRCDNFTAIWSFPF